MAEFEWQRSATIDEGAIEISKRGVVGRGDNLGCLDASTAPHVRGLNK